MKQGIEVVSSKSLEVMNKLILFDSSKGMFIKSLDEYNKVDDYTSKSEEALKIPNTLNFKNSIHAFKYDNLLNDENIQVGVITTEETKVTKIEW